MAPAAEAQSRKQQAAPSSQNTVFITRDENGRTTTRVIVTPRSYLDGGTDVLPGQRKFNHRGRTGRRSTSSVPARPTSASPSNPLGILAARVAASDRIGRLKRHAPRRPRGSGDHFLRCHR